MSCLSNICARTLRKKIALGTVVFLLSYMVIFLISRKKGAVMVVKKSTNLETSPFRILLKSLYLRQFKNEGEMNMYLYGKIFSKVTNEVTDLNSSVTVFRNDIKTYPNTSASLLLTLAKENTLIGSQLIYYLPKIDKRIKSAKYYVMKDEIFKLLPEVSPFKNSHYKSCSVVGNSGILWNSECGEAIDHSDYVFRCNAAPLAEHVKDVGIRSNFTTMNPSVVDKRYHSLKNKTNEQHFIRDIGKFNGHIWMPCFGVSTSHKVCLKTYTVLNKTETNLIFGNPYHFHGVFNFWNKRKTFKALSTGFYLVNVALQFCDEVNLYGFWPYPRFYQGSDYINVSYHYFDDMKLTTNHGFNLEFNLLVQMHLHGMVNMNVGKCSKPLADTRSHR